MTDHKKRRNKKGSSSLLDFLKGDKKRKKTVAARSKKRKEMPRWQFALLSLSVLAVFGLIFYFAVVKPYSYRWKSCYGHNGFGVCMPYEYSVHGFDISHYQERINWDTLRMAKYAKYPLYFVFIKATEGKDLADTAFAYNFANAKRNGFLRSAYHFFVPQTDARQQADFFIRTVKLEPGDLPPVLDVEKTGGMRKEELQKSVLTWLRMVQRHYGVAPILYTSYKFKQRYLNDQMFEEFPYWIAHYYVDSVRYKGPWQFWQHTDVGEVPGIPKRVDLNVFKGSLDDLVDMTIP